MGDRYQRYVSLIITMLIIFTLIPVQVGEGDGIPAATYEVYSSLRENRQLAYVTVNDDHQVMDLFLNVVSLRPNETVTILIPLITRPMSVNGKQTTDEDFTDARSFDRIRETAHRQGAGAERFKDTFINSGAGVAIANLGSAAASLYVWASSFGLGASISSDERSIYESYTFNSMTVDLHNLDSDLSVAEFFADLNLTGSPEVQSAVNEYRQYNVAVVNVTTTFPVEDQEVWESAPKTINSLEKFSMSHPRLTLYERMDYLNNIELNMIFNSFKDETGLRSSEALSHFSELVSAIYGVGKMNGYSLRFKLPLDSGSAFFPLGTSPAWRGMGNVKVIFECDKDEYLDFNDDAEPGEAFFDGRHYYYWDFVDESPDFDLEGEVKDGGFDLTMARWGAKGRGILYHLQFVAYITPFILQFLLCYIFIRSQVPKMIYWTNFKKRELLLYAVVLSIFSFIASIWGTFITLHYYLRTKRRHYDQQIKWRRDQRKMARRNRPKGKYVIKKRSMDSGPKD